MHSPTLYPACAIEQWTLPCQLGINAFKLAIVTAKVKVIVLQMVSHFILSVSPSSSSMSRERIEAKASLLEKSWCRGFYAYCFQRLCVHRMELLNYETQNVSLQSFKFVSKVNIILPLPRLPSSLSVLICWVRYGKQKGKEYSDRYFINAKNWKVDVLNTRKRY